MQADTLAPRDCILGCAKVTLTQDCSTSSQPPLGQARNDSFGSKPVSLEVSKCFPGCPQKRPTSLNVSCVVHYSKIGLRLAAMGLGSSGCDHDPAGVPARPQP